MQFSDYGTTEQLRIVDVTHPAPGPGQVRPAVRAAGAGPIDWKILQGATREQIPLVLRAGPGSGVAGVVDAIGEGVTGTEVGDEALGTSLTPPAPRSHRPIPPHWLPGPARCRGTWRRGSTG
ncbi:alcohol dehydrogenase catalytic domain-containing protein [Streptomyces sp. NPDC050509]|uniref:alcohol dehydrogenase catalytic domain-containing protein n=1 Tax=Streptomyces sp. NPDC050509 TaxID=3365620 RepID=UPI0037B13814